MSKAKYLIVDTSAFINNVQLQNIGEKIITIPEVIHEIRNKRQYRHLKTLIHDVELKDVFNEYLDHVIEFSKKTGDYTALSRTDLKLIALTYQLEVQEVGRDHLRTEPVVVKFDVNKKIPQPEGVENNALCLPIKLGKLEDLNDDEDDDDYDDGNQDIKNEQNGDENVNNVAGDESSNESADGYVTCEEDLDSDEYYEELSDSDDEESIEDEDKFSDDDNDNDADDDDDDEDDDDSDWITPNNFKRLRQSVGQFDAEEKPVIVGCLSTDFAIQNVLLQMGLNVVSVDGKVIKNLRTYILRCYACFKTTSNMRKIFCPTCGNKTLKRVSVFLDKDGNRQMFINFKRPLTARGKRFSLPAPKTGKHAVNPRLVEDARRPHQKPTKLAKMKTSALDDDYLAACTPFVMRDVHSRSAHHGFNKGNGKVGFHNWMQRNPNESRRRSKK